MERNQNKKVIVVHALYILAAEIVSVLVCGFETRMLLGLFVGFLTSVINYLLLALIVGRLLGRANILAVQLFLFRYLLYLINAYLCMRNGTITMIMYSVGIIGLSFAIFITYGIGGMKNQ